MARILVTGARGFTGRHLVRALGARGHEVHALVASAAEDGTADASEAAETIAHHCDLMDAGHLETIVRTIAPEKVAHLAAISFAGHADVESTYRINVVGTRNLLSALGGSPSRPVHVLLASSASVYGAATVGVIDESAALAPPNDYAVSKLAMEYMAWLWRHRLPLSIVRPFNYTGPGQSESFVIPKIVAHFRDRKPVIELGNLDIERDFSDVRTVVDAYVRILDRTPLDAVVNVCSGRGTSLREVLDLASALTGFSPEVRINPEFVRANDPPRLVGSKRRLEEAIGTVPGIDMRETLEWMLE